MSVSNLYAARSGSPGNPTLILLHGAGMSHWMWQPQMEALAHNFTVVAPDLPGIGGSAATGPFSIATAADAVIALIRQQGLHGAHLCGLSLGAVIALEVALRIPDLTKSLTLSGCQIHPNPFLLSLERAVMAHLPERTLFQVPTPIAQRYPEVARGSTEDVRTGGRRVLMSMVEDLGRIDYRARLREVSAPTLVLCGSRDRVNLPAARALGRGIPNATLRIVPGVGHVWNLERPDLFTKTLLDFLRQVEESK